MAAEIRILHTADSHIGADLPKRAGGTQPRRGTDFVDSFNRLVARVREFDVDCVIHAGDLFDGPQPGDGAIAAATKPLWELACAGTGVLLVPGNHERSVLPHTLLLSHPNIHVFREPRTVMLERRGVRVAVSGFPCIRRGAAGRFAHAVHLTGWDRADADVRILAVHQTFAGARCGPGNFQFREGDDVVPCEAVPAAFHYVAAGHIHRHQCLRTAGPPLVYAGSPDRIAFAELGEPKGGVLVTCGPREVAWRFLEQDVRPMAIVPLDVTGLTKAALLASAQAAIAVLPAGAVVLLRLSGQASRSALAGLRLTAALREARADAHVTVSSQAIQWISDRVAFRRARSAARSAFAVLDAPPRSTIAVRAADAASLPAACGTYALYDGGGRLLYIGKALHLRNRVRAHLRGDSQGGYFAGWSAQVEQIEVRPAASELEALLVEAELIRRLAPAFNRQMRLWQRYCYLCSNGAPFGQLVVAPEPNGRFAFGPLRSRAGAETALEALCAYLGLARCPIDDSSGPRALPADSAARLCQRHFDGVCAGPCACRIGEADYARRLRSRDALLAGRDSPEAAAIEAELEALGPASAADLSSSQTPRERILRTLRDLRATAELLREARALLNTPLTLPGEGTARVIALITPRGLHLEDMNPGLSESERIRAWILDRARGSRVLERPALPKPIADMLCTAVRALQRHAADYRRYAVSA